MDQPKIFDDLAAYLLIPYERKQKIQVSNSTNVWKWRKAEHYHILH